MTRSRTVLAADAVWDVLLGVALMLVPLHPQLGPWWPLFVVLGIGCIGYAVLLARAATSSTDVTRFARVTAAVNGAGAVLAIVLAAVLAPPLLLALGLLVAAIGCALFAALESRTS